VACSASSRGGPVPGASTPGAPVCIPGLRPPEFQRKRLGMARVVVVYHSGYGHTQRMAQAVAEGANADLLAIDADGNLPAGGWEQLKAADAIIFGCPTYMGNISWQFKKFADASSKPWYAQEWKDKLAGGFTNSAGMSGDKFATLTTLFTLAMQHSMIWVSQGLMPSNTKAAKRDDVNYLVSYSGAMAQSPSDGSTADMARGDLVTAKLFGQRVADIAARFKP
jgi:NAD(P)H dehydrogenase (quinone)